MDEKFDIQAYLARGVENIVSNALRATLKDPRESAFMVRFAAASRRASQRRAEAEKDGERIESKAIAGLIKPGMTTEEIADIMAKEMARSFAEPYRLEPFLAPAQVLHDALERGI